MDKNLEPKEISIKEIAFKFKAGLQYINAKKVIILVFIIIGASLGLLYSIVKKPLYAAVCTFVLEDGNKGGGIGQYAGLASLAGIDLGGMGGTNGIFQTDNILQLYKSRTMIEKALLSEVTVNGKKQLLMDRYITFNNLDQHWKNDGLKNISFTGDPHKFNRTQDSIISEIVNLFNKSFLTVDKLDKKLSIIQVTFLNKDEQFAKDFSDKLVETVNDFYSQTKTKRSIQNINILQRQVDSVRSVLNKSISGVASAIDASPNANPTLSVIRVPSQKKQVDVQANNAIYAEMVKNLEISKMSLLQETPLIQVIDQPVFPLVNNKLSKIKATILGGFLFGFLALFIILLRKALQLFFR